MEHLARRTIFMVLLMLGFVFTAHATRVTMNVKNVKVTQAMKQLKQLTGYTFVYYSKDIDANKHVVVQANNADINDVVAQILVGQNVDYTIDGKRIIVSKKPASKQHALQAVKQAQARGGNVRTTGTIVDSNGEPIIGATIRQSGTNNATISGVDGHFQITTSAASAIEISYVGFQTQTIKPQTNVRITMKEQDDLLNEVVVVGYGVQKRASVTGAVASVDAKSLVTVKSGSVTNALAGKIPGLQAVQRSGAPGDDNASINIRGFGNALVIVDGVERDFSQLDSNDIESISVLKDASAAVYGFKGANGVILVTTKSGAAGKPKITYNGYVGFQKVTRFPDYYNGYEYASLYNEALQNVGIKPAYSDEELQSFKNGIGTTNWYDEVIRNSAPQTYQNISVSGGADRVKYFFSFGYLGQEGIYKSKDYNYKRYNVRSNISAEIVKGFIVDLQLGARLDNQHKPWNNYSHDVWRAIQMAKPVFSVYANDNPRYYQNPGDQDNPIQLSRIDDIGYQYRDRRIFNGQATFTWKIPWIEGLTAKALFSFDYNNQKNRDWWKEYYDYNYDAVNDTYNIVHNHRISELTVTESDYWKPNGQISLNYQHSFGKHDVSALVLWEFYNDRNDWERGYRQFDISAIDQLDAGNTTNQSTGGNAGESAHEGLVGRINYAYANKYLAEFAFRYDGSYKFDPSKRWGFFPSVSLGYRISEEDWFKEALPIFDNLKIRGSWGKVGDESGLSAFQYLSGYTYPSGGYVMGTNGVTSGASDKGMPNTELTWYKSTTKNIGFEGSIYSGLLSVEFDYFWRHRDGLLANRLLSLPTTFGVSLPQENLNSDKTSGFEIVVGHHNKIAGLIYDVKANFSTTRNYNRHVERAAAANMYDNWRNNSNDRVQGIQWGYVALGQFKSYEDILNSPIQDGNGNKSLQPGDIKYEDWNKDGIIDDKDVQPIGRGNTPHMYYGLNLSASYKNFDLTLFFQGAAGHEIFTGGDFAAPFIQQGLGNGVTMWLDRWHRVDPSDPASEWIPGNMPSVRTAGFSLNERNSTWSKQKEDYLRLKTLEFGYTLPKAWLNFIGIENLRIYINGFNLFTITSRKGMMKWTDPENSDGGYRYYPQVKTYNFGMNLTF